MILTWRNKFNLKYGFPKDQSHTIEEIAKITGYSKEGLDVIFSKGMGAYFNNFSAVRRSVKSPQQWAQARIYSAVMGGKAQRVDSSHLIKTRA